MNNKIMVGSMLVCVLCQLNGMANSEGMKKIRAEAAARRAAEQRVQAPVQQPQQPVSTVARPRIK